MKKLTSHSLEETQKIARDWLKEISELMHQKGALIVGLSGHLGAGKTAFVKAVAKELGIREEITSPTFVIMKIYPLDPPFNTKFQRLIHIDAYRLEKAQELEALGFERLAAGEDNLIMVEWPENVGLKTKDQIDMKTLPDNDSVEFVFAI
jgi:tRNA threonylcarbamoyladenosine biosynthesis protein TsaE